MDYGQTDSDNWQLHGCHTATAQGSEESSIGVMELNTTIFSGSGSADNIVDQTTTVVPKYISYAMVFSVLLSIPLAIIPALSAIVVIVKNKKLQSNNNIFLINVLLTDVGIAVTLLYTNGLYTVLYLLNVNIEVNCRILLIPFTLILIANKLMFLPMCVDRFIHIAFPFLYKRIVTTKAIMATIITLWVLSIIATSIISYFNGPNAYEYMPSLGICKPIQVNTPQVLILLLCFFIPILVITIKSIYLCQWIIKSKNFFHSVKKNAAQERKSDKAGRLLEILQEQVKPTLAVFRVGGIDAVLDILISLLLSIGSLSTGMVTLVTVQLIGFQMQYIQSVNHFLVYNCDIREKLIGCKRVKKCSKVITMQR